MLSRIRYRLFRVSIPTVFLLGMAFLVQPPLTEAAEKTRTVDLTTAIGVGVALGLAIRLREKGLEAMPWLGRDH